MCDLNMPINDQEKLRKEIMHKDAEILRSKYKNNLKDAKK